ncbi:RluA family pseudouridine synthase [Chitinolyticbacter meiyuanensis]|uniref:RluA family pseudouridine synthase n=1 Tax=Chitinolyticbacter meiyuanensis TaxID=682798 RepID=UPI0011E5F237|nr:RluA family pseudouridine synthase [Chitinolyticbacter meiyuanensis]
MSHYQPPADTGLDLVHLDDHLLVLAKPAGLLAVPGRGEDKADSLATRAAARYPGVLIVHRLDMDTSGLMVLARNPDIHRSLSKLFHDRIVDKRYVAVVEGKPKHSMGEVDQPLNVDWPNRPLHIVDHENGKRALTRYWLQDYDAALDATRVLLEPVTGRTHQLRVHMQWLGHPILGDTLYAQPAAQAKSGRLLLHAAVLELPHPVTGEAMRWESPAPF